MVRFRLPLSLAAEPHFDLPIVVLQSDDWGQPSVGDRATLERLWPDAAAAAAAPWSFDARESVSDIEALADTLVRQRDRRGRAACMTLNWIVCEPDYGAIEASAFGAYRTRPLADTSGARAAAQAAALYGCFEQALHGAEHVAPSRWLSLLRAGTLPLRRFFDAQVMPPPALIGHYPGLGAAYLPAPEQGVADVDPPAVRLPQALAAFESLFGRRATGFVAPNHAWDDLVETVLAGGGIRFFQACHVCYPDWDAVEAGRWTCRRAGPARTAPLWYQTRSVDFEPALRPAEAGAAIARACLLAQRGIPVVVNTHRLNYAGGMGGARAEAARQQLGCMLRALLKVRPDLLFLSSSEFDEALRGSSAAVQRRRIVPAGWLALDLLGAVAGRQPGAAVPAHVIEGN